MVRGAKLGGGEIALSALNVSRARIVLRELVDRVAHKGDRVVLSRYGKPSAALVSIEDLELLEKLEDQLDIASADEVMKNLKPVPWDKAKKQLGL